MLHLQLTTKYFSVRTLGQEGRIILDRKRKPLTESFLNKYLFEGLPKGAKRTVSRYELRVG